MKQVINRFNPPSYHGVSYLYKLHSLERRACDGGITASEFALKLVAWIRRYECDEASEMDMLAVYEKQLPAVQASMSLFNAQLHSVKLNKRGFIISKRNNRGKLKEKTK